MGKEKNRDGFKKIDKILIKQLLKLKLLLTCDLVIEGSYMHTSSHVVFLM